MAAPVLMGIVNVTPDSFSDGGETADAEAAVARGLELAEQGAAIIDVGGESTRPGAGPVTIEEELRRVTPVISALAAEGVCVSVDTRHARVMEAALTAGARVINDVTALTGDGRAMPVAAASDAGIVLMHMKGEPGTMNVRPVYGDVVSEVRDYLSGRIEACLAAGISEKRLAIDPGIGFGKLMPDNFRLIENLEALCELGPPVLVGVSRKIGKAPDPRDRLAESLHWGRMAVDNGAAILRVHDVAETAEAVCGGPERAGLSGR